MSNLNQKPGCPLGWKRAVLVSGLLMPLVATPAWAKTIIGKLDNCSKYAYFILKRDTQVPEYVEQNQILEVGDQIWIRWESCTITLIENNKPRRLAHDDANQGEPYEVKAPSPFVQSPGWWLALRNLWKEESKREVVVGLAAGKGADGKSDEEEFSIPLLNGVQKIVGTGERYLHLGWPSVKDNPSYTVIVKRQGYSCVEKTNCWKTTTSENAISLKVDLDEKRYEVIVQAGSQSATGRFKVIASYPKSLQTAAEKQQKEWISKQFEQLKNGDSEWKLEIYQLLDGTGEEVQEIRTKLAEQPIN